MADQSSSLRSVPLVFFVYPHSQKKMDAISFSSSTTASAAAERLYRSISLVATNDSPLSIKLYPIPFNLSLYLGEENLLHRSSSLTSNASTASSSSSTQQGSSNSSVHSSSSAYSGSHQRKHQAKIPPQIIQSIAMNINGRSDIIGHKIHDEYDPRGILKTRWLLKYSHVLPSRIVLVVEFPPIANTAQVAIDDLSTSSSSSSLNVEILNWEASVCEQYSTMLSTLPGATRTGIDVALISPPAFDPLLSNSAIAKKSQQDRINSLRKSLERFSNPPRSVFLFVQDEDILSNPQTINDSNAPSQMSAAELSLWSVLSNPEKSISTSIAKFRRYLSENANEFYRSKCERIKSNIKGIKSSRNGNIASLAKGHFKLGKFYEFRNNYDKSLANYLLCFNSLKELSNRYMQHISPGMLQKRQSSLISTFPFAKSKQAVQKPDPKLVEEAHKKFPYSCHEIKSVAELTTFRICSIYLYRGDVRMATEHFRNHIHAFETCLGPDRLLFQHYAWMSRQFVLFGRLLKRAGIEPTLAGSQPNMRNEPMFYFQRATSLSIQRRKAAQMSNVYFYSKRENGAGDNDILKNETFSEEDEYNEFIYLGDYLGKTPNQDVDPIDFWLEVESRIDQSALVLHLLHISFQPDKNLKTVSRYVANHKLLSIEEMLERITFSTNSRSDLKLSRDHIHSLEQYIDLFRKEKWWPQLIRALMCWLKVDSIFKISPVALNAAENNEFSRKRIIYSLILMSPLIQQHSTTLSGMDIFEYQKALQMDCFSLVSSESFIYELNPIETPLLKWSWRFVDFNNIDEIELDAENKWNSPTTCLESYIGDRIYLVIQLVSQFPSPVTLSDLAVELFYNSTLPKMESVSSLKLISDDRLSKEERTLDPYVPKVLRKDFQIVADNVKRKRLNEFISPTIAEGPVTLSAKMMKITLESNMETIIAENFRPELHLPARPSLNSISSTLRLKPKPPRFDIDIKCEEPALAGEMLKLYIRVKSLIDSSNSSDVIGLIKFGYKSNKMESGTESLFFVEKSSTAEKNEIKYVSINEIQVIVPHGNSSMQKGWINVAELFFFVQPGQGLSEITEYEIISSFEYIDESLQRPVIIESSKTLQSYSPLKAEMMFSTNSQNSSNDSKPGPNSNFEVLQLGESALLLINISCTCPDAIDTEVPIEIVEHRITDTPNDKFQIEDQLCISESSILETGCSKTIGLIITPLSSNISQTHSSSRLSDKFWLGNFSLKWKRPGIPLSCWSHFSLPSVAIEFPPFSLSLSFLKKPIAFVGKMLDMKVIVKNRSSDITWISFTVMNHDESRDRHDPYDLVPDLPSSILPTHSQTKKSKSINNNNKEPSVFIEGPLARKKMGLYPNSEIELSWKVLYLKPGHQNLPVVKFSSLNGDYTTYFPRPHEIGASLLVLPEAASADLKLAQNGPHMHQIIISHQNKESLE